MWYHRSTLAVSVELPWIAFLDIDITSSDENYMGGVVV